MRDALKHLRRPLRRLLVGLIALVALVNGLAFLLTPLLDHYRDDLAALASERLGMPVAVGSMHARWRGYGPEIVLNDLRLGAPDRPESIRLSEAAVDFGLWDMLRYRDLSPLRITLRQLEIHLIRDHAGKLHLAGFDGITAQPARQAGDDQAGRLPLSGRLRLEDATVLWEDQRLHLPVRRLEHAQLRLHLWPDRLALAASVKLPGKRTGRLHAAAELDLQGQDWSGEVYLAGKLPEAAAQLGPYLPEPLRVTRGGIELEVWSEWEASRLAEMEGKLAVEKLYLDRGPDTPALDLDAASTEFRYRRVGEQRQVDLAQLTVSRDGHSWPATDLHLGLNLATAGHPDLLLSVEYLRLADLLAMSQPAPLSAELAALRDGLAPDAVLRDLRFRLEPGEGPPRWQLSTRFDQLDTRAWQHYPGVMGLRGSLQGDQQQLTLQLTGEHTQLDLPSLFRAPLPVRLLQGDLQWRRQNDGWELGSDQLTLNTPDIDTVTRFRLSQSGDEPLQADLQSDFGNGESSHAGRYYPVHIMKPELVAWLDRAIGPGSVPRGTVLLRGPLRDFPYDKTRSGHFEVRFDVAGVQLDYLPDWPLLTVDDAEVRFHNNSLDIQLRKGRIYDSQVLPTQARIATLHPVSPLEIQGAVQGPLADPLRLLAESPLKARFGEFAGGLQAQGQSQLALDFAVVLHELGEDRLTGSLDLQQAGLVLPGWDLALSGAEGQLVFDLNGVRAQGIRATALGRPVRIDVSPSDNGTLIEAASRMDIPTLLGRFPQLAKGLPDGAIQGESGLTVAINIPRQAGDRQRRTLQLRSDLVGIQADLPAPLGKTAEASRPLTLDISLDDEQAPIRVTYDRLLQAVFRPGGDRLGIRLGGEEARLPDEAVLHISGRLEQFALEPWLKLADQPGEGVALPPLVADLDVGRLGIGRLELDDVKAAVRQTPDGWQGSAMAPDFAGRFDIPPKDVQRPMAIDLERLKLTYTPGAPKPHAADVGDPNDWPELDLNVTRLLVNDKDFGRLSVRARHQDNGLTFKPVKLEGPLLDFEGEAYWQLEAGRSESGVTGALKTPALGDLLAALGYTPQFEGAAATSDVALHWPGDPAGVAAENLQGELSLAVGQGQLLEIDPGVSRVFGLLNFGALQRRLRLDFSDLFKKGLSFDSITGRFRLVDGNAYTRDLKLKGPSGTVQITGRTGLAARDLYQEVTVDPKLDATLPVAGALAAGPWAGVAVLVAQQLMKKKVEKFNRIRYQISGSWDDPKVEQLDDSGGLSRLLKPVTDIFGSDSSEEKPGQSAPASQ